MNSEEQDAVKAAEAFLKQAAHRGEHEETDEDEGYALPEPESIDEALQMVADMEASGTFCERIAVIGDMLYTLIVSIEEEAKFSPKKEAADILVQQLKMTAKLLLEHHEAVHILRIGIESERSA